MFKTAQFIDIYYPLIDGVVSVVNNYALNLNTMEDVYCCVVAPKYKNHEDAEKYDIIRTSGFKLPFFEYMYGTPALDINAYHRMTDLKPNILHAHSPFEEGKFAVRLGEKLDIPVVATFHSKYYDDFKQAVKSDPLAQLMTDAVVRFFERCDYVWTMNKATERTLHDYGFRGDVQVIPHGADMDYYDCADELREKAIAEYGLPRDKRIILFVGQIAWKKNLRFAIDVVGKLGSQRDDFLMVFAGSSFQEDEVKEYTARRAPGCTRFLGKVASRDMLAGVYAAADLFFFPSLYDTASLVVREAAQMHLPSLLIDGADAAEGIVHLKNGFLTPQNEYLCVKLLGNLLDNPDTMRVAGDVAATTLPRTWQQVTQIVLAEYRRLAAIKKPKQFVLSWDLLKS